MDKKIKEKWLKELRDPKNEQAQQMLLIAETGARCCIGVLSDVAGVERNDNHARKYDYCQWTGWRGELSPEEEAMHEDDELPPPNFESFVGLPQGAMDKLSMMNDGSSSDMAEPKSFAQIADYIEENY